MTFIRILCQLLNLGHLEIARSNSKKSVNPGLSNLGWKKVVWHWVKELYTVRLPESRSALAFSAVTLPILGVE